MTLAPWKKSYDKPGHQKQRHHFANKGQSSQSYVFFSVVMYGCESWTIKKADRLRINVSELWCWRRLLSPLDSGQQGDQTSQSKRKSTLNITGRTDAEAQASTLWPPRQRADPLEKTLMLIKLECRRRWG